MSSQAARKLEEAGFTNVHDYEGGTKAWQEAGLPVEGETIHA
jgi:rhodanese-related sulfurtransferase